MVLLGSLCLLVLANFFLRIFKAMKIETLGYRQSNKQKISVWFHCIDWIFLGLLLFKGPRIIVFAKFSRVYAYLKAYAYCFGQFFQCLCLFEGLRLLGSLEYPLRVTMVAYLRIKKDFLNLNLLSLRVTICEVKLNLMMNFQFL